MKKLYNLGAWKLYCDYVLAYMCVSLCVFLSLPHGAMAWSVISDCGLSWSYSLCFLQS